MNPSLNPYAAPVADGPAPYGPGGQPQFWIEGNELVAYKGAALPDLCIFSGEPVAGGRVNKKLQWYPPWVGALVVISAPIALILMLVLRKKGELSYCVGPAAKKRRTTAILIASVGSIGLFLIGMAGIAMEQPILGIVGLVGFVVALLVGLIRAQLFQVKKIDQTMIRIKVKPAFLQALNGR